MKFFGVFLLSIASVAAADDFEELQQGNLIFSSLLYQQISKNSSGNIIFSPLSVQLVLALTQLGARGETALELKKGLYLPDSTEKLKEGFKSLVSKLKGNQFYSLDAALKIYLKVNYIINPDFLNISKEIFDTDLEVVNFEDKVNAANTINKWVENKTDDKIKNLIDPDSFNELTRMVLVNALHFKGSWALPFEPYGTFKRIFYKSEKEILHVDTMHQTSHLQFVEIKELDAKMLQIPYKGKDITFTIVVPNQIEGLAAIENRLSEVLRPQNYTYERVSLYMPKFKMESTFKLIPALKKLGIIDAFDPEKSNFSGLLVNDERLVITDVIQKAFIDVTEAGTEAAAATAVIMGAVITSVDFEPPSIEVKVDRPFFCAISIGGLPIFLGRVKHPTL